MSFTPKFVFVGFVAIAVVVVIIFGLVSAGSPAAERIRRGDEQRVSELQQISYAVDQYWAQNGTLPASLEDLAKSPDAYVTSITDPRSGEPYVYRPYQQLPLAGQPIISSYQLCATFEGATPAETSRPVPPPETFWNHDIGETCFDLEARTEAGTMKASPIR